MAVFTKLLDYVLELAAKKTAIYYLAFVSFIESIIFPIPVDVMLAPMAVMKPSKAYQYAWIATFFSVIGGVFGYFLGFFLFDHWIQPILETSRYWSSYETALDWFAAYGVMIVFVAGFSPIPYKVFTLAAGVMNMSLPLFIVASAISRGLRFYLVAWLMCWKGEAMLEQFKKIVDYLGYAVVIAAVIYFIVV